MRPFNNYSGYHINASYGKTETTANVVRLDEFLAQNKQFSDSLYGRRSNRKERKK